MEPIEKVTLTNMCMIYENNKVLVQAKRDDIQGIVFPGGHVEKHESIVDSVIREMYEETGLNIYNPQLCGIKDWIQKDGSRYMVFLYKTDKFSGNLKSSEEGDVFWVEKEQLPQLNLVWNMKELLNIFFSDVYSEFFFKISDDNSKGILKG